MTNTIQEAQSMSDGSEVSVGVTVERVTHRTTRASGKGYVVLLVSDHTGAIEVAVTGYLFLRNRGTYAVGKFLLVVGVVRGEEKPRIVASSLEGVAA